MCSETADDAATLRRALTGARLDAGLTEAELAAAIGSTQAAIADFESGSASPTMATLRRLANVLALRIEIAPDQPLMVQRLPQRGLTLTDLRARHREIVRIASSHGAENVRVFGSVARGEADAASDVDLLVDIVADADGLAYFGLIADLRADLSELLDRRVDVLDAAHLGEIGERVLREAVAV